MTNRTRQSGFTLLEIMITLALVSIVVFEMLQIRESATNKYFEAQNANFARSIVRELITELEFHELPRSLDGPIDGYPGFEYRITVEEVDLVTGQGDPEAEKREEEKRLKRSGDYDSGARFVPQDALPPEDEMEELVYPVRKVKLTLRYPNLDPDAKEPHEIVVETILPPLPEYIEEYNERRESPFGSDKR